MHAQAAQLERDSLAALALELGESLANASSRSVDLESRPGLRIDQRQMPDRG
jgi:hypothetical protein